MQANAIGSIFYVAGGLYNPELYKAAVTGVQPAGRRLQQKTLPTTTAKGPDGLPDPYGFIPAVRLLLCSLCLLGNSLQKLSNGVPDPAYILLQHFLASVFSKQF